MIGIVVGPDGDLDGVRAVREAVVEAGMVPLVVAQAGGVLGSGEGAVTVQRTYATARSVEFDAVLLAGLPGVGSDAYGARDAKAFPAAAQQLTGDPRVTLLVSEAFRHGKAVGAWAGGEAVLEGAGVPTGAPGVVVGDTGTAALEQLVPLLGGHRAWDRFTAA